MLLCWGKVKAAGKSNEITTPTLLEVLESKGCIVTIDAMGCQRETNSTQSFHFTTNTTLLQTKSDKQKMAFLP
jgi:predicted transposase YbfD/YdcC